MGRGKGEEGREKGRACKIGLNLSVYGQARVHFVGEMGALRGHMTHTAGFILAKIKSRCSRSLWGLNNEGQ